MYIYRKIIIITRGYEPSFRASLAHREKKYDEGVGVKDDRRHDFKKRKERKGKEGESSPDVRLARAHLRRIRLRARVMRSGFKLFRVRIVRIRCVLLTTASNRTGTAARRGEKWM